MENRMLSILLFIALLAPVFSTHDRSRCYADITNPYIQFATNTAYKNAYVRNASPVFVKHCQPQQFWLISRHGTRYPPDDGLASLQTLKALRDQIVNNHDMQHRGHLCSKDLENLKNWNLHAVTSLTSNLNIQGYHQLYNLALRYKARFPALLNETFSHEKFQFRFTDSQRTTTSAFAFAEGMFGPTNRVYLPEPLDPDMLLKGYGNCKKWDDLWPTMEVEMVKFQNGTEMQTLIQNVSQRLGFNRTISLDNINAMYDGCRFDHAWHVDETSPWCAAFSKHQLKVLEYREDLLYYYYTGYGTDLNTKMGCAPVKDLLDRFSEIENGNAQPAGVFYFTHSEMLQLILLPLGIARDQHNLTHTSYEEMRTRLWRTSKLTPFAANLAAVYFKCEVGEQYKVQFYLNEHPINLDGCQQGLCDWSVIKEKFGTISKTCNFDFC